MHFLRILIHYLKDKADNKCVSQTVSKLHEKTKPAMNLSFYPVYFEFVQSCPLI